ncbi:hypothetical protein G7B40_023570 [Aetokthonos hydrillicola Thurmond2011]|uniref:Uncharacterized protein n=1 Tax=Aetokthonos hydrillicola Thurmond2011 TaxID=2712845 RepID=A0AAP5IA89_9CYAN|nr:hypothetical protein [Aetokthonos hydrillicola]MBO3460267.1 hypothetical protein [Aetokthonos hydrillicola CCALA 1050]MBW4587001.1 hypothetical protein [Aetokthonos hydrillicola CCALA 1050]MDR9897524.1 hypothetical protein [Aetokthonos hydrillicola Thurmond2011]
MLIIVAQENVFDDYVVGLEIHQSPPPVLFPYPKARTRVCDRSGRSSKDTTVVNAIAVFHTRAITFWVMEELDAMRLGETYVDVMSTQHPDSIS